MNPGYTTNISLTGMFIATRSPFPPHTRLRIEVLEGERGFVVEGMVVHARKVRGELVHLSQPGMGVRFVNVDELVRELIPGAYDGESLPASHPSHVPSPVSPRPAVPPPSQHPNLSASRPPTAALPQPERPPAPPPPPVPPPVARPIEPPSGTFSVHFLSPAEFVEVFLRDIVNGGLFVNTRFPARIQEVVYVELYPPFPGAKPVLVQARVVQRFEPSTDFGSHNLLAGMGVELLDLSHVVEKLQVFVHR